jgi:hypothetical protein
MKTLSNAILIGLSIGFLNIAFAEEHFNDRSNLSVTLAASEPTTIHPEDRLSAQTHFNDGNAWVYEVPIEGSGQCAVDSAFWLASSPGFNDKYSNRC